MPPPDGPRRRAGLPIVLCTVVVLGASSCTGNDSDAGRPPDRQQVADLLQRQGEAVVQHDRSDYLAGFTDAFRRRQRVVFDNLARVPLARWSYRLGPAVTDADAQRAVRRKYDDSAVIVQVQLRYAIRSVDTVTSERDLWWTVVRRDGRPVVVGDGDLAAAGGVSWRGPWDFGRLDVVRGRHSIVLGHPQNSALSKTTAGTLDRAVPAVSAVWGADWNRTVAAIVPATRTELTAALGPDADAGTGAEVGAIARSDGDDPVTGRPVGQRVVVVPAELQRLSTVGRQIVLQHEVTHIATGRDTPDSMPRWLVEGFADYVGNLDSGQSVRVAASELAAQVRRGGVPRSLPDDTQFAQSGTAASAYQQSWLACRYLASLVGQRGLVRLYRAVADRIRTDPGDVQAAVATELRTIARTTPARFVAGWRTYVQDRVR